MGVQALGASARSRPCRAPRRCGGRESPIIAWRSVLMGSSGSSRAKAPALVGPKASRSTCVPVAVVGQHEAAVVVAGQAERLLGPRPSRWRSAREAAQRHADEAVLRRARRVRPGAVAASSPRRSRRRRGPSTRKSTASTAVPAAWLRPTLAEPADADGQHGDSASEAQPPPPASKAAGRTGSCTALCSSLLSLAAAAAGGGGRWRAAGARQRSRASGCGCRRGRERPARIVATRAGIGDRSAASARVGEAPGPHMRPQQQLGDAVARPQRQRNVAGAVAMAAQRRVLDQRERQVQRHRQRDAELHDHAAVGDGVDGGARGEPGEQREQRRRRRAAGSDRSAPTAMAAEAQRPAGQLGTAGPAGEHARNRRRPGGGGRREARAPKAGRALPEDVLARRQRRRAGPGPARTASDGRRSQQRLRARGRGVESAAGEVGRDAVLLEEGHRSGSAWPAMSANWRRAATWSRPRWR